MDVWCVRVGGRRGGGPRSATDGTRVCVPIGTCTAEKQLNPTYLQVEQKVQKVPPQRAQVRRQGSHAVFMQNEHALSSKVSRQHSHPAPCKQTWHSSSSSPSSSLSESSSSPAAPTLLMTMDGASVTSGSGMRYHRCPSKSSTEYLERRRAGGRGVRRRRERRGIRIRKTSYN